MPGSREQVIDVETAFPPAEEDLDFPAKEKDLSDLFGGKVEPVGCDPVRFSTDAIADDTKGDFGGRIF